MNNISELKSWLDTGNEIEFMLNSKEYSITYGNEADGKRYISFCEFYKPENKYDTVSDFLSKAKIDGTYLYELWESVTDITVY
jgi:hypothetical protein